MVGGFVEVLVPFKPAILMPFKLAIDLLTYINALLDDVLAMLSPHVL